MDRKEFLEKLGIGAAFALTATCIGGCTKDTSLPPQDIDFVIDLNDDRFAELANIGGFVVENDIVIARSISGQYLAATVLCSHEPNKNITYRDSDGVWFCTVHGAEYTEEGEGLNSFGANNLTVYQTSLDGDLLRVFS